MYIQTSLSRDVFRYMYMHIEHVLAFPELSFLRTHFGKDGYNSHVSYLRCFGSVPDNR